MSYAYIIYQDEDGEHGYAPISFYNGANKFLDYVIIKERVKTEQKAQKLTEKLNGNAPA